MSGPTCTRRECNHRKRPIRFWCGHEGVMWSCDLEHPNLPADHYRYESDVISCDDCIREEHLLHPGTCAEGCKHEMIRRACQCGRQLMVLSCQVDPELEELWQCPACSRVWGTAYIEAEDNGANERCAERQADAAVAAFWTDLASQKS